MIGFLIKRVDFQNKNQLFYISITKLSCEKCNILIDTVNVIFRKKEIGSQLLIRGTHGLNFNWKSPLAFNIKNDKSTSISREISLLLNINFEKTEKKIDQKKQYIEQMALPSDGSSEEFSSDFSSDEEVKLLKQKGIFNLILAKIKESQSYKIYIKNKTTDFDSFISELLNQIQSYHQELYKINQNISTPDTLKKDVYDMCKSENHSLTDKFKTQFIQFYENNKKDMKISSIDNVTLPFFKKNEEKKRGRDEVKNEEETRLLKKEKLEKKGNNSP